MGRRNPIENFWSKVDVRSDDECWEWTAARKAQGYGHFKVTSAGGQKSIAASRFSALIHFGMFDRRLLVCHHCDNPACVNPRHLYLGTAEDNQQDRVRRGRHNHASKTHCPSGHAYDEANTYLSSGSKRHCRTCHRERFRARQLDPDLRARHAQHQREYTARQKELAC